LNFAVISLCKSPRSSCTVLKLHFF
jgi:hypothetical protein